MSDIKYTYPLILNKVASPHYATPTLRRARLLEWLNDASGCRAAVIAADAGYGKTTLLWQWEREASFPCYWYKIDRTDRDWTFHISYLIESISKRHPGFGRRAHSMLQQLGGPGTSRPGVAAYLLAEMHQRLTEPCTFIIDDWQYVNAVTEVRGLWNQILRDAPPTCRFVFASRVKPRLQFARFKTHAGYAELRTDALRFTESEIAELFRDIYDDPLDPAEVVELERRTEGWAASLQLVEVSLRERTTLEERRRFIHSITATKDSDLFDFLAEEVLDQQPDETRNFLLSTSILQQITPEVAQRLAGVHDGTKELTDLEQRGLFTNRLDEVRFRYHNLFREFLERRLIAERSEAEVVGLHIHAASYFETTEQWPEAIHHYLRAGLQRQAARLIAKYGEDVVAEGRLGLVDEWLQQLPEETIKQNARLSLLYGEACGIRGDWNRALEALDRARTYFARKGDRRFEALACLKLSSVYSNYGDPDQAAQAAEAGVELVPPDAVATRLRLEGNLAITRTWLTEPLDAVVRECQRIAVEAAARGLEHFAAIAHHNAGGVLLQMGRLPEAIANLERAARFWSDPPTSPFADNTDLVLALLAAGRPERARVVASDATRRTEPWPRPLAHARYGLAAVHAYDGRYEAAIAELSEARSGGAVTGGMMSIIAARLVEAMYLDGAPAAAIRSAATDLDAPPQDKRYVPETVTARAIAIHLSGSCEGECLEQLGKLASASERGETLTVLMAQVKIGVLAMRHPRRRYRMQAWASVREVVELGLARLMRGWLRHYAPVSAAKGVLRVADGPALIARLAESDPEGWRPNLVGLLPLVGPPVRGPLLSAVFRNANRETIDQLRLVTGSDVDETRRRLQHLQAARLFVRTFGNIGVHRSGWSGPEIRIEKKRVRALLGVLAAHATDPVSRDAVIDLLWPDADGDSAINSLNQTVFQLRRYLDPNYRGGDSPEYILSNSDHVSLNDELIRTDLAEVHRMPDRIAGADWQHRHGAVTRVLGLIRGEFLADLRYEDWANRLQLSVHTDVRRFLLPIAQAGPDTYETALSLGAAQTLLKLDPFDEAAVLALASAMARSGKRVAARDLVIDYVRRVRSEFDDEPSSQFVSAAGSLGVSGRVKPQLISGD